MGFGSPSNAWALLTQGQPPPRLIPAPKTAAWQHPKAAWQHPWVLRGLLGGERSGTPKGVAEPSLQRGAFSQAPRCRGQGLPADPSRPTRGRSGPAPPRRPSRPRTPSAPPPWPPSYGAAGTRPGTARLGPARHGSARLAKSSGWETWGPEPRTGHSSPRRTGGVGPVPCRAEPC